MCELEKKNEKSRRYSSQLLNKNSTFELAADFAFVRSPASPYVTPALAAVLSVDLADFMLPAEDLQC